MLLTSATAGFLLSLSLILAIGAQNAFVLRQGLKQTHVFTVCLFCGLSDAVLIAAGVVGFGALAHAVPGLETAMRYGGSAFLFWYGWLNARSAWEGGAAMDEAAESGGSLLHILLTLAAITWLNPHVYLDTVVLIGSISAQYDNRLAFGIGAVTASLVFFFTLGYGARLLSPLFRRPRAWQMLDAGVAFVMWTIAVGLVTG